MHASCKILPLFFYMYILVFLSFCVFLLIGGPAAQVLEEESCMHVHGATYLNSVTVCVDIILNSVWSVGFLPYPSLCI